MGFWQMNFLLDSLPVNQPSLLSLFFNLFTANIMKHPHKTRHVCMQMFAATERNLQPRCFDRLLSRFDCCLSAKDSLWRAFACTEGSGACFRSVFSLLIAPFSVILGDFNFRRSFPKLPVISNNHILWRCVCTVGAMSPDTCHCRLLVLTYWTCLSQERARCSRVMWT